MHRNPRRATAGLLDGGVALMALKTKSSAMRRMNELEELA
jgi:hypothetical protein